MTYAYTNIVIFHPAAIGDAVLATPVSKALKLNYPGAKITYWSHPSLRQLISGLCPSVDDFVDFSKETGLLALYKTFKQLKPDLFVDLSSSRKSLLIPFLSSTRVLRYVKERYDAAPSMHAVDNFLETIAPVCHQFPRAYFPTLFPDARSQAVLPKLLAKHKMKSAPMIGLVPGVGNKRPHRAWLYDGWHYLLKAIGQRATHLPVLIGGEEEIELCTKLNRESGNICLNLAGQLALPETAAVLKQCQVVISGDTGPAHIAVAVGTSVIGLYGPTFPQRSGPYGNSHLVLDQSSSCKCTQAKICHYVHKEASGECMQRIMLAEVLEKLEEIFPGFRSIGENPVTPEFIEGSYM